MSQPCPLCNVEAQQVSQLPTQPLYAVNCPACGKYHITMSGLDYPLPTNALRGKVSAWTRQEHEAGHTALVTDEKLFNPPKLFDGLTVESKLLRALQTVARKWPNPSERVALNGTDWPLFCDTGKNEFEWLFATLFKRGFIDQSMTDPDDRIRLTALAWQTLESANSKFQQADLCFVAMRFLPELDPLFASMKNAAARAGYFCQRVDTDPHADNIDQRLIDMLKRCRFVIADFTENSHNVYFEAGFAKGMDKPVIWTKRVGEKAHFDTRQFYFIEWSDADWADFELRLETSIGAIVGRLVAKLAAS